MYTDIYVNNKFELKNIVDWLQTLVHKYVSVRLIRISGCRLFFSSRQLTMYSPLHIHVLNYWWIDNGCFGVAGQDVAQQ